jgi:hypothetical protein
MIGSEAMFAVDVNQDKTITIETCHFCCNLFQIQYTCIYFGLLLLIVYYHAMLTLH